MKVNVDTAAKTMTGATGGLFILAGWLLIVIAVLLVLGGARGRGHISISRTRVTGWGSFPVLLLAAGVALMFLGAFLLALPF